MLFDLMHLSIDYKPILMVTVSLSAVMIWTYANLSLEMNIHFPRMCFYLGARISLTLLYCDIFIENHVARAEAMLVANTDNQYLVPTSGNPLRGLIQDHVVAGVWMTSQDTFLSREEYFQLLYGALRPEDEDYCYTGRLETLPPTIWKPKPLWTGKQIVESVLLLFSTTYSRYDSRFRPFSKTSLRLNLKASI